MLDYLLIGVVLNVLNMFLVIVEEVVVMGLWIKLVGYFGVFIGQMIDELIKVINVLYDGVVVEMNLKVLNVVVIVGVMKVMNLDVNMVLVLVMVIECGVQVVMMMQVKIGVFDGYIKVMVVIEMCECLIVGMVFSDGKLCFIQICGINVDVEIGVYMLYICNCDVLGVIGVLGMMLGDLGVNIVNFIFGCIKLGDDVIVILYLDEELKFEFIEVLKVMGKFL